MGPVWSFCPNKNFFRKPFNKPCSFHSCLSTFQKSNSNFNPLRKYWRSKNTEISLAESYFLAIIWEPDFPQVCSFCKMLMDHKNLRFTPIPDKTNDFIFLKSHHVLGDVSGHFCPMGIFSKKFGSVTHNYIWAPNTMPSFTKN